MTSRWRRRSGIRSSDRSWRAPRSRSSCWRGRANRSVRIGIVTAIAWCAVQAYTGAVFIALSVFTALLIEAALARRWTTVARRLAVITCVVSRFRFRGSWTTRGIRAKPV